jgi:hypothetical protein
MTARRAGFCGVGEVVCDSSSVGKEFGGLDAAGGQVCDEFAIGQEEVVGGEFAGEDPGDLLEDAGGDVGISVLGGEEMDFEFFGSVGVLVADAGDFDGLDEGDAELLPQFAGESLLEGFAGADFAPRKFPFEGRSVAAAALADEESPISTLNYSCYDLDHCKKC